MKINRNYIYFLPFLLDFVVLGLFLIFPQFDFFNMDYESNFPTMYQGIKLFTVATLAFNILILIKLSGKLTKRNAIVFSGFLLGFMFLAVDELGQIHDNIQKHLDQMLPVLKNLFGIAQSSGYDSSPWLIYYIPIMIAALIFFVFMIKEIRSNRLFLFLSFFFFSSVIVLEFISSHSTYFLHRQDYVTLITFEEMSEQLGASFMLLFTLKTFNQQYDLQKCQK